MSMTEKQFYNQLIAYINDGIIENNQELRILQKFKPRKRIKRHNQVQEL